MLSELCIRDFTVIRQLELEFTAGMTVLTGETGAGKSLLLDALGLVLGGRAEGQRTVRDGCVRAEISARFQLAPNSRARALLRDTEFDESGDGGSECLVQRSISAEGRSRARINGRPCTVRELSALGEQLAVLHSQHAHYSLSRPAVQRLLLDSEESVVEPAAAVRDTAAHWHQLQRQLEDTERLGDGAHAELLRYQCQELSELGAERTELEALDEEHRRLAGSDALRDGIGEALQACENSAVASALAAVREVATRDAQLQEPLELLQSASSQLGEARRVLEDYLATLDNDPARLAAVEERIAALHRVARKHRIAEAELPALTERLTAELAVLEQGEARHAALLLELSDAVAAYHRATQELSAARATAAQRLVPTVTELLHELDLEHARFELRLEPRNTRTPSALGAETPIFEFSANPGQTAGPLSQIPSGGELSRLGLALQVATAARAAPGCLVFDEADTGIGSAAADRVGTLLRSLGSTHQVLCVTHLAQVASHAEWHMVADKTIGATQSQSQVHRLENQQARVLEIARLLSGRHPSQRSLAHAQEILAAAQSIHS